MSIGDIQSVSKNRLNNGMNCYGSWSQCLHCPMHTSSCQYIITVFEFLRQLSEMRVEEWLISDWMEKQCTARLTSSCLFGHANTITMGKVRIIMAIPKLRVQLCNKVTSSFISTLFQSWCNQWWWAYRTFYQLQQTRTKPRTQSDGGFWWTSHSVFCC